jgi:predicted small lipoprotein YifL
MRAMRSLVLLAFSLCVAACGQTGDLYLPDEPAAPTTSTSTDDSDRKKDPTADVPPKR